MPADYADLTTTQKHLFDEVEQDSTGADLRIVLQRTDAAAADKAAVADVLGGAGAGREFLEVN